MLGADLSPFFQSGHFAQAVVWNAVTGFGILDAPGELLHEADVLSVDYAVTVETAKFGAAQYGDPISVGGVNYTVRYARPIDDGALSIIIMTKV